jgi:hypothetical protein
MEEDIWQVHLGIAFLLCDRCASSARISEIYVFLVIYMCVSVFEVPVCVGHG